MISFVNMVRRSVSIIHEERMLIYSVGTENFLKTLFIVSEITLHGPVSAAASGIEVQAGEEWSYSTLVSSSPSSSSELDLALNKAPADGIELRVCPARGAKCPRCWTFTREEEVELCERCADAVAHI